MFPRLSAAAAHQIHERLDGTRLGDGRLALCAGVEVGEVSQRPSRLTSRRWAAAAQQRTSAEAWQQQRAADGERAGQVMLEMEEEAESVRCPPLDTPGGYSPV